MRQREAGARGGRAEENLPTLQAEATANRLTPPAPRRGGSGRVRNRHGARTPPTPTHTSVAARSRRASSSSCLRNGAPASSFRGTNPGCGRGRRERGVGARKKTYRHSKPRRPRSGSPPARPEGAVLVVCGIATALVRRRRPDAHVCRRACSRRASSAWRARAVRASQPTNSARSILSFALAFSTPPTRLHGGIATRSGRASHAPSARRRARA